VASLPKNGAYRSAKERKRFYFMEIRGLLILLGVESSDFGRIPPEKGVEDRCSPDKGRHCLPGEWVLLCTLVWGGMHLEAGENMTATGR